jgi:hypothetical protein
MRATPLLASNTPVIERWQKADAATFFGRRSTCSLLQSLVRVAAFIAWTSTAYAAVSAPEVGGDLKKIGVVAIETRAVAPQLIRHLRRAVLDAFKTEEVSTLDLIDDYAFLAGCQYSNECLSAALRKFKLDYVLLARLAPSPGTSLSKPDYDIVVELGRMPHDTSAWGPWPMSTTCPDCSDTDLIEATRQLVSRTWKAMRKAEAPPQNIEVSSQDRRSKGAKLLKIAEDEKTSAFEQIYLLKKAIQAGAGGQAFMLLAGVFFECHGYDEAEDYLSKAAAKGVNVDSLRGPILWFTGRWADAEAVFQTLTRVSPQSEHFQRVLAQVKRRNQDYHGVLWQADAELGRGDASEAAQLARIALASGRGTRAHLVLARAALQLHHHADALAQFISVLDDEPNNAEALAGKKKAEDGLRKAEELRARR